MKKKALFLLFAVVLTVVLLFLFLLSKTESHEVRIGLSFNRTLEQIQDSIRRKAWFKTTVDAEPVTVESVSKNPLITSLVFKQENRQQLFNWIASPEPGNEYFTVLRLQFKTTWWDYLRGGTELEKLAIENTNRLEAYTKDIKAFYGYEIRTTHVKDSTLLYGTLVTSKADRPSNTVRLFNQLIQYARERNADFNGSSICNFENKSSDSVLIKASIGIRNPAAIPLNAKFQVKRMPYGKNLLEMDYVGPFGEIPKGYRALEQFRDDHNFKSMAIPYQEYPDPGKPYKDSQQVTLRLYYPVF